MKPYIRYYTPAVLYLIVSIVLLTLPGSAFPSEDWLSKIYFDKWVHIGMFAILTFLFCWGYWRSGPHKVRLLRAFILIAFCSLVYGIVMEYVQRDFVPNRSFDVGDIIADGVGCLLGTGFSWFRFIKK